MAYATERSFSELIQDIVGNLQTMIRSELRLAKTEVKEETSKAARAGAVIAAGALLGIYAVGFLLLTVSRALEISLAPWQASLFTALLTGAVAFAVIMVGRSRMRHVHPKPEKTIQTIKENVQWVKDQTK